MKHKKDYYKILGVVSSANTIWFPDRIGISILKLSLRPLTTFMSKL